MDIDSYAYLQKLISYINIQCSRLIELFHNLQLHGVSKKEVVEGADLGSKWKVGNCGFLNSPVGIRIFRGVSRFNPNASVPGI